MNRENKGKTGFYEPRAEVKKSFRDELEGRPKHRKSVCRRAGKKMGILGGVLAASALILTSLDEKKK